MLAKKTPPGLSTLHISYISSTKLNLTFDSLEVTITQGSIEPSPIAITDFYSNDNKNIKIGKNISTVISDNLERSGLFIPKDKDSFIQNNESLSKQPRFEDWKLINADHLVSGKISSQNNRISVEFILYDVQSGLDTTPTDVPTVSPIDLDIVNPGTSICPSQILGLPGGPKSYSTGKILPPFDIIRSLSFSTPGTWS